MSDLHTRLDKIAGPAVAPSPSTVDADLSRGRRALRRRRTGRIAAGSGLAVAAAVAAALAIPATFHGANSTPVAGGHTSTRVVTRLVAFTGTQPAGFTLDLVPAGWQVQGVDTGALTLAPTNATDTDPHSFVGKIGISLESAVPDVAKTDVRVGDQPGVLATMKGDRKGDGGTLFVKQPSGAYLSIQVWSGLGWGEKEIVQFATGVHVNEGAVVSSG
jgi:hypothetical protein